MARAKLIASTSFRLVLLYVAIFALGSALVLVSVGWEVEQIIDQQIAATVNEEIKGLSEQYAQGGLQGLYSTLEKRARQPGSSLYLLTDPAGQVLAGNIAALPPRLLDTPGAVETHYRRPGETQARNVALARIFSLPGGLHLLVGRDMADREALRAIFARSFLVSLAALGALGLVGGLLLARRVLARIDAMSASAAEIMAGNLEQRLPQAGSHDEFDRLAQNLNAMLDRINRLMADMREVTDNIAHDLKTPLTRLRNRAEQALAQPVGTEGHEAALEQVIIESDRLLAVFNALLQIARVEGGTGADVLVPCDVGEAAQACVELYQPMIEEADGTLDLVTTSADLHVKGSRELLGQAISNLIINALNYGVGPEGASPHISVACVRLNNDIAITVSDAGPGIAPADLERVKQRFVRLETSRSTPGSGMGLALVDAVAGLHGGSLSLTNANPGLSATLRLPALPPQAPVLTSEALAPATPN